MRSGRRASSLRWSSWDSFHASFAGCLLLLATASGCGKVSTDDGADSVKHGSGGQSATDGSGGSSPEVDWTTCDKTSQCALIPSGCCEGCGDPALSDYRGINRGYQEVAREQACAAGDGCPECETNHNPHYFSVCTDGHCEARDLAEDEASTCETDDDCSLLPPKCCERIRPDDPPPHAVAINSSKSTDFHQSLCAGVEAVGPPCEWMEPQGLEAKCEQSRCVVSGE